MPDPRLRRPHLVVLDVLGGLLLAIANFAVAGNLLREQGNPVADMLLAAAAAATTGLSVALRRRTPRLALALALAATLSGVLADPSVAVALTLYTGASVWPHRLSLSALALSLAVAAAGAFWQPGGWIFATVAAALTLLAWLSGTTLRRHRAESDRLAGRLAEQQANQIRLDERLRIARELHDVVAHGMGLIAVKAAVANHVAQTRPEETRDALRVIEATSKEALAETRRLLSILRDADPTPPDLPTLLRQAEEAGVHVDAEASLDQLPDPVRRTALRIIQEALTNVLRHASGAHCRLQVTDTNGVATIEITDTGPADQPRQQGKGGQPHQPGHGGQPQRRNQPHPGSQAGEPGQPDEPGQDGQPHQRSQPGRPRQPGHGLLGMRERVALYQGEFTAGPHPDGGFHVHATLPYRRPE